MKTNLFDIESEMITLDCNMKLRYVKRSGFNQSYVGIVVNYGSCDYNFIMNGKDYYTKKGIAHFIEHKCFSMPDGSDSFYTLTNLGVSANAYTSYDRTLYFFQTVENIYKPLGILLDTVFTNGFTEENIEHEKNIICSEINMYEANLDYKLDINTISNMYKNTGYEASVAGTIADVKETTLAEILANFTAFYHPSNLILTIVGDIDKDELISFVNMHIKKYQFNENIQVSSLANLNHFEVEERLEVIAGNIEEEKFCVGIRLNELANDVIEETIIYDYIMDLLTSDSSDIYHDLLKRNVINPDLYYEVSVNEKTRNIVIMGSSNDAKVAVEEIIKIIDNLSLELISEESLETYKRNQLGECIKNLDNIFSLGEIITEFDLTNVDYFNYIEILKEVKLNQVIKYLKNITESKKSKTILVKS